MKKQYSVPKLTSHGNVEAITQLFGASQKKDFLFFSGSAVATGEGNKDGYLDGSTDTTIEYKPQNPGNGGGRNL